VTTGLSVKILRIDDFDAHGKARQGVGANRRRVFYGHLCIYKIFSAKSATYYRYYIDHEVAHLPEHDLEKWLLRHLKDDENLLIDQVDLA
jgi:hypothetical protein